MPTLHRTASCFKLGFPGVRELRPSQQAPGIAVRVSLRRRERSSDVPCSEPPLQGSPRPSMPRVENRRFMWTCTVRCLHCMACGTCAHAGVRNLPSRNAEPSAKEPRQGEGMRVAVGESTRKARAVVCTPKSRGPVNACPAAPSLSALSQTVRRLAHPPPTPIIDGRKSVPVARPRQYACNDRGGRNPKVR